MPTEFHSPVTFIIRPIEVMRTTPIVRTGLDIVARDFPAALRGKRVGLLCHAASVTSAYEHITACFRHSNDCTLAAIFGPQHGLFGQTQDNMVEWEGRRHPQYAIPVYSLYGRTRKPGPEMLDGLDALVIDLQDVGARPYTYAWTVKLCMEACEQAGIPVWILDRPNPIGAIGIDGPMLLEEFFSFVGGACIPLCHRLTLGEIAVLLKGQYFPSLDLEVVWMNGWWRNSLYEDTHLPWVLPSPNMPRVDTAMVYPGMVLLEGTNVSEGRGSTVPFELFGAPYLNGTRFRDLLRQQDLPGCVFREHCFIPTFHKWCGEFCRGVQIHVTDPRMFRPVLTAVALLRAAVEASEGGFAFKEPPYEYEHEKMPFDILSGGPRPRQLISRGVALEDISSEWAEDRLPFESLFADIAHYPEERT